MKTRISQLAVALFFAFVLITGNVNATEHKTDASSHEYIQEASLKLEKWMMDENVWSTSDMRLWNSQETNLRLEGWMTNQSVWDVQSDNLNLESWMMDENVWEVQPLAFATEKEKVLEVENWMVNEAIWN